MNHKAQQHPVKQALSRYSQVITYAFIIAVFFFALWLDDQNEEADLKRNAAQAKAIEVERCRAGVDTRNVDRDQTQRIYSLALGSIPKNVDKLSDSQKEQIKAYVKRVEEFRRDSFATIKPSSICKPYVKDDVVTPEQWEKTHPSNQAEDEEPGDNK